MEGASFRFIADGRLSCSTTEVEHACCPRRQRAPVSRRPALSEWTTSATAAAAASGACSSLRKGGAESPLLDRPGRRPKREPSGIAPDDRSLAGARPPLRQPESCVRRRPSSRQTLAQTGSRRISGGWRRGPNHLRSGGAVPSCERGIEWWGGGRGPPACCRTARSIRWAVVAVDSSGAALAAARAGSRGTRTARISPP